MRVSGPRALDPDSYDRFSCAVCMELATPMLLSNPRLVVEDAGGAKAAVQEARSLSGLVECTACKVRVHRECYGVPEGVGALGAGEKGEGKGGGGGGNYLWTLIGGAKLHFIGNMYWFLLCFCCWVFVALQFFFCLLAKCRIRSYSQ